MGTIVCEYCGKEIEGNYVKYKDKYFCRHDNDECLREWLYDQTDGECEYGTIIAGEKYEINPEWTEVYLNTLGMSKQDF